MRTPGARALSFENITRILKQHKEELAAKYGIQEIGAFCPYVRGKRFH
jgi:predicted nucleotidyltransferase